MTVREIVKEYLEKNGYDGLCCDSCSCSLDVLMLCGGEFVLDCEAGYFMNKEEECKKCTDYNFCIDKEKDSPRCPSGYTVEDLRSSYENGL